MTQSAHPPLPQMNFRTIGLSEAAAFAHWRELMAPLFTIEQARYSNAQPRGNLTLFVVGEIMASRNTFNAQHLTRGPALIAATPNHLVLQYYRYGGFHGTIAGQRVSIMRGQVAVCDLGEETDAYAASSDTIGLSIPKSLLGGIDPAAVRRQLDAPRNRLLGGYLAELPKRLARMDQGDIPTLTAEVIGVLERVFAPDDPGEDQTIGAETPMRDRALGLIDAGLGDTGLSPALLAERLGISRGSLYRLFAPMGGIMRYIQERRLMAVRDVLNDPLDRRSLAQLAADHGFGSQALLSRGFRAQFGVSPRDWRQTEYAKDLTTREPAPDAPHQLWRDLGRKPRG